jgi:hypothetical protein
MLSANPIVPVTDPLREAVARFAGVPPFDGYIDPTQIVVTAARGKRGPHGKRAECHFTKFSDSRDRVSRDGRFVLPEIRMHGREIRYVISFVLPRFLFLPVEEQAKDVVHELYHIDESFSGIGSRRRHGPNFDYAVERIAARAAAAGIVMPHLATPGQAVLYHRFRPFPRPVRTSDPRAQRSFDERDLELAALRLDERDREPPPARFVYVCPVCEKRYRRMRPLRAASCGACSDGYDSRFRLTLLESRERDGAESP